MDIAKAYEAPLRCSRLEKNVEVHRLQHPSIFPADHALVSASGAKSHMRSLCAPAAILDMRLCAGDIHEQTTHPPRKERSVLGTGRSRSNSKSSIPVVSESSMLHVSLPYSITVTSLQSWPHCKSFPVDIRQDEIHPRPGGVNLATSMRYRQAALLLSTIVPSSAALSGWTPGLPIHGEYHP